MGFTFRIVPEHHLRVVTMAPVVTEDTLRASSHELLGSPAYDPSHDVLVDLRGSTHLALDSGVMSAFAAQFARVGGAAMRDTRLAIVAGSDEQFGMGRMYGAYRSGVSEQLQVFRHAADACAWLGVPLTLLD